MLLAMRRASSIVRTCAVSASARVSCPRETGQNNRPVISRKNRRLHNRIHHQPGQSGNPAGRPKGARNKLSENFLNALADDFDAHGQDVIAKVRESRPHEYLRVVAATLPKRLETEPDNRPLEKLTDEELTRIIRDTEQTLRDFGSVNSADQRA